MVKYNLSYLIIIFLCAHICIWCTANDEILCQSFDGRTKSIVQYCEQYQDGSLPQYCLFERIIRIRAAHVKSLTVGGCAPNIVLQSIKRFKNVHTLDISQSGYTTLNWLRNLTLMQLHRLNASRNSLTYVYQLLKTTTPNVMEIDLSHNKLMTIGTHTLGDIRKLRNIFLSHNHLEYISFDAFIDSEQLTFIDLRMNRFHEVPPIFENERTLQTIDLTGNPVDRFNFCYLDVMRRTSIHISWENIERIWQSPECHGKYSDPLHVVLQSEHEGIFFASNGTRELHCNEQDFTNLKNFSTGHAQLFANIVSLLYAFGSAIRHLDLTGNWIGAFSDAAIFEHFDRLTTLSLSHTQLTHFDLGVVNPHLTKLDLSFNRLQRIENAALMERFVSLVVFNISGNRIGNVAELVLNPSIEQLDLSGNYLGVALSDRCRQFEQLSSLRMLHLNNCGISKLTALEPFKMLRKLNKLHLSHNNLRNVSFSILSELRVLSDLSVAYCELDDVTYVTKYLDRSIRTLNLAGNNVPSLDAEMLKTLVNLEYLNVSNVKMVVLESGTFRHHYGLQGLDLTYNKLKTIDLQLLPNNVQAIYLSGNSLQTIENLNQTKLSRLSSMSIAQNQFSCQFLRDFLSTWRHLTFDGDPLVQRHDERCRSSTQGVKDFLTSFYDTIKFW